MRCLSFFFCALLLSSCHLQAKWIFSAKPLPEKYQYTFEGNYSEFDLKVEKNRNLNVLHFKVEESKGLIFYCHGNDGTLNHWGNLGSYFNNLGYDAVMMDYAGYGKSDPKLTTEKRLFEDIQMLYDTMKTLYSEEQIVIYGRSIGTGIASSLLVDNNPKMLVLETPYYNFKKLVRFYAKAPVPLFIVRFNLANNEHIMSSNIPVYIFSGTEDEIIPHQQSVDLANLREGITLYTIENGRHSNLDEFDEFQKVLRYVLE